MATIFRIRKLIENIGFQRNNPKDVSSSLNSLNLGQKENLGESLQLSTQSLMGVHGVDSNLNISNIQGYPNLTTGFFILIS